MRATVCLGVVLSLTAAAGADVRVVADGRAAAVVVTAAKPSPVAGMQRPSWSRTSRRPRA